MTQYIDKAALVAEIERRKHKLLDNIIFERDKEWVVRTAHQLNRILLFLDSIEMEEMDLDREIRCYRMRNPIIQHREESLYDYMANVAKHFFELGLKAKDLKKERMEECHYRKVGCTMYDGKILECTGACGWVVDHLNLKKLKAQKGE